MQFQELRIVYYHHIIDKTDRRLHAVSIEDFRKQLKFLKSKFKIIPLSQAVKNYQDRKSLKGKICISFDDGFASFYKNAFPILKEFKVPATVFLISNCFNNNDIMWRTKLEIIKGAVNLQKIQELCYELSRIYALDYQDQDIMKWSLSWEMSKKDKYAQWLWDQINMPPVNEYLSKNPLYLSKSQILECMENGIEFGSHTKSHPLCNKLSDEEIMDEVLGSINDISILLNRPVKLFAYPFGLRGSKDQELLLIQSNKIDTLLGTYFHKHISNSPFIWERDDMEIPYNKIIFKFSRIYDYYAFSKKLIKNILWYKKN